MINIIITKIKLPFLILAFLILYSCAPSSQSEKEAVDFKEAVGYRPVSQLDWKEVPAGINVSFGNIDTRYGKYTVPDLKPSLPWKGTAWKGERVSAQVLIWTTDKLEEVSFTATDFIATDRNVLDAKYIRPRFVRYVVTDEYGEGGGARNAADHDSLLVADILDPAEKINIHAKTVRPVWITIDVPATIEAGDYSGRLIIRSKGNKDTGLLMNLKVYNKILPAPSRWAFHLDLWQNPYAVARYHGVDVWSDRHFELLRPLMVMLAEAGQKCITTSIVDKPWGGQTYDPFGSMIKWKKEKEVKWEYDYTVFDRWVEFAMSCGITGQINCYSMLPWRNRVTYYDETLLKDTTISAQPGTGLYKEFWAPFLSHFEEHLKEKGWFDKTVITMDEREPEDMQKTIALVREVSPDMKIALAGNFHKQINDELYDLSAYVTNDFPEKDLDKRREKGQKSTYYVCCIPEYPNTFTFSPTYQSTFIGWYAAAKGFDGFLRWAYNSWVEDPLIDSRYHHWSAGDTYLVYPGPRSSIRFERLREGIQDYEKIRLLRQELKQKGTEEASRQLQQLDSLLKTCDWKDAGQMQGFVYEGKQLLEKLSEE